jgi:hypothetical protein
MRYAWLAVAADEYLRNCGLKGLQETLYFNFHLLLNSGVLLLFKGTG